MEKPLMRMFIVLFVMMIFLSYACMYYLTTHRVVNLPGGIEVKNLMWFNKLSGILEHPSKADNDF
jgi:hypothetical protein